MWVKDYKSKISKTSWGSPDLFDCKLIRVFGNITHDKF